MKFTMKRKTSFISSVCYAIRINYNLSQNPKKNSLICTNTSIKIFPNSSKRYPNKKMDPSNNLKVLYGLTFKSMANFNFISFFYNYAVTFYQFLEESI